jgi:glycosyltransferase involved in cell wall biosynthesis
MSTEANPKLLSYLALEATTASTASYVHVTEIIAGLERRNWSVRLLQPSYTADPQKRGVTARLIEYARVQYRLWRGRRIGEGLYFRAHYMALPTAMIARVLRIPIVHEVNGSYLDIYVTYPWLTPFSPVLNFMQRIQFVWADRLLPVTTELATWLEKEAQHSRITIIPNGANIDLFHPQASRAAAAPNGPYVIFFGSLAAWHGVATMLKAAQDPAWPPHVKLVIIGDGPDRDVIMTAAEKNPRIVYLGYQPYPLIAGFVAPALCGLVTISDPNGRSRTGLFPLKLFETLACGVPVIVTDFPGQADLVRQHGCGIIVPVDNSSTIAEAVAVFAADPALAQAMGACGSEIVRSEHSWDRRAAAVDLQLSALITAA